jgi:CRISPR/Cas system CSM-associated protein Csm2 small subunit
MKSFSNGQNSAITSIKNSLEKNYSFADFNSNMKNNTINYNNTNKALNLEKIQTCDNLKPSHSEKFFDIERNKQIIEKQVSFILILLIVRR